MKQGEQAIQQAAKLWAGLIMGHSGISAYQEHGRGIYVINVTRQPPQIGYCPAANIPHLATLKQYGEGIRPDAIARCRDFAAEYNPEREIVILLLADEEYSLSIFQIATTPAA